jgi:hypothetical protein
VQKLEEKVDELQRTVDRVVTSGVLTLEVEHEELMALSGDDKVTSQSTRVAGCVFTLEVDFVGDDDQFLIWLCRCGGDGPDQCKVKCTAELLHDGDDEGSAEPATTEFTYSLGWELCNCVLRIDKDKVADADDNSNVKDGYVTFKCTVEVVA